MKQKRFKIDQLNFSKVINSGSWNFQIYRLSLYTRVFFFYRFCYKYSNNQWTSDVILILIKIPKLAVLWNFQAINLIISAPSHQYTWGYIWWIYTNKENSSAEMKDHRLFIFLSKGNLLTNIKCRSEYFSGKRHVQEIGSYLYYLTFYQKEFFQPFYK